MVSIQFNIKRKTGKKSAIRAIVRIDGKTTVISTGISVDVADWNAKRQRCKNDVQANEKISQERKRINDHILKNGVTPKSVVVSDDIIEHIRQKAVNVERMGSSNSAKVYHTLASKITKFNKGRTKKKKEINKDYVQAFCDWLTDEGFSNSHITKQVRSLKTVASEIGIDIGKIKAPANKVRDAIYLTPEEIESISKVVVKKDSSREKVKDIFLIACYTALRFSDISRADQIKTIGKIRVVQITQQKTGEKVSIPITEKLEIILAKYRETGIPKFANQFFNREIKEIAKEAGITAKTTIVQYRGGKKVYTQHSKYELVSSHTGRRSFATNAINSGIPAVIVMKFTGHRSLSSFMTYIRSDAQDAAIQYHEHEFFK